jgi:benzoyl-CoA reductase/2-hydroxyglutaryl-CoA dehydratase subunit BcrC/BadD/HgdB
LESYNESLKTLKKQEKAIIGYFTNRVPVEILHALDTNPVRMLSLGSPVQGASERYVQIFACSWLRQILDAGLARGFEALDGVVFSAGTCDSLQNFSDIWRKVFPDQFAYNLTFPVLTDTEAAKKYLKYEFEALINVLATKFSNNGNELKLDDSIDLYNSKRAYLQKLASLVSKKELRYSDFAKLLLLADIIPVETTNQYLKTRLQDINSSSQEDLPDSPRLLLTGGMFDNYKLWELSEFDHLVVDDLSFGTRNINFKVPKGSIDRYTHSYLDRIPDPTAYDMDKRLNFLKSLIKDHEIDGVILLSMKWCDPDTFEFVPIQNSLKEQELPYLRLETTPDLSNQQQLQTRLAAFIEMLS